MRRRRKDSQTSGSSHWMKFGYTCDEPFKQIFTPIIIHYRHKNKQLTSGVDDPLCFFRLFSTLCCFFGLSLRLVVGYLSFGTNIRYLPQKPDKAKCYYRTKMKGYIHMFTVSVSVTAKAMRSSATDCRVE